MSRSSNVPHAPAIDTDVSLELPHYGAPPIVAITRFLRKYATFSGRASRAEFWWAALATALFPLAVQIVNGVLTGDWRQIDTDHPQTPAAAIVVAFQLAILLPSLAVTWRRLHDTGRSGAWFFLIFLPLVGWIWLLVLLISGPSPAGREYDRSYLSANR